MTFLNTGLEVRDASTVPFFGRPERISHQLLLCATPYHKGSRTSRTRCVRTSKVLIGSPKEDAKHALAGRWLQHVKPSHFAVKVPCLLGPLVSLDTAGEELDGHVDLFFDLRRHLAHLFKGENTQSVQLLFDEWPNALDGL